MKFILNVHEQHNFELLWVSDVNCGNSYISFASCDGQLSLFPVEHRLEMLEKYSEAIVHKNESKPRNSNINTLCSYSLGEIFESVT